MILSPQIKVFVKEHEADNIHSLALKAAQYPDIDFQIALRQIAGRKVVKDKIPTWYANENIIYPNHLSLEQSSSEYTARYKATLCSGKAMVDLTGGLGIDFSFISANFEDATYVEQQKELTDIASHNLKVLKLDKVQVVNSDAIEYLSSMSPVDLIYIDPARRDSIGKKTVSIKDCTPNIQEIESLLEDKAEQIIIKLSPMLDISLALNTLKNVSEVHVVSVNNECKELLFVKNKSKSAPSFRCVNILKDKIESFDFLKTEEIVTDIQYSPYPEKYLYEPNTSILKAGAYKSIAKTFSLSKLHPSSHLYTSDTLHEGFQGRKFIVESVYSLNKVDLKNLKQIKQANITTRNFPITVQDLRKKTGIKEGGGIYIFATTLADERKVLIVCRKV